eukprot:scaffold5958_cov90-Skeletonema_dohrnii-CCMP3373.AAC.2
MRDARRRRKASSKRTEDGLLKAPSSMRHSTQSDALRSLHGFGICMALAFHSKTMAAYGLLLLITMLISSISAFSIKIVGLPGGKVESLPGMYVNSFRRWIAEEEEQSNNINNDDNGEMNSCASNTIKIEPIAGAGISIDEGWVNPTSTADLFWPLDVKLQARPALN